MSPDSWMKGLQECLLGSKGTRTNVVGVGNPLRGDDAFGLETVSLLRRRVGPSPTREIRIHRVGPAPEFTISRVASRRERLLIFDAVETASSPGTLVFAPLWRTKYGYFGTHNLPLKLVPGVADNIQNSYIVGVQPESVDVGEGLSEPVARARDEVVSSILSLIGGRK